jgi:hypothetical protein
MVPLQPQAKACMYWCCAPTSSVTPWLLCSLLVPTTWRSVLYKVGRGFKLCAATAAHVPDAGDSDRATKCLYKSMQVVAQGCWRGHHSMMSQP